MITNQRTRNVSVRHINIVIPPSTSMLPGAFWLQVIDLTKYLDSYEVL